ncbi:ADAMTS-like protein 1 isoform X4 [Apostichopus japonicus]
MFEESYDDSYSWSQWSGWSDCTGNCSGGISRRNRECLFGVCRGPPVQYRTCNIEPCPEGTKDFRERQCEIFNDVQYDDQVYNWTPVSPLPAADECALICKGRDQNVTRRLSPTVLDGTPCRSGSRDMCLNGKCIPIGCNYEFNSTSTLDRCLVCGGDNSTCKVQKGRKISHLVDVGLEEVLLLQKGSFSVKLVLKGTTSLPGIKTEDGLEGINQKATVTPGRYIIGGTEVQFGQLKNSGRLSIVIPDKLKQNFWVTMLRTKSFTDGDIQDKIVYQYIAPVNYAWGESEWSTCTKSCAAGVEEKSWSCYDQVTNELVDDVNCNRRRPENIIRDCNTHPCPLEWKIGPWSGCSRTCGGGVETRTVSCVRESVTGVQYMNQDFCPESPALHRSCNTDQCPRWQIMTDWSECSVTCATGETSRLVQCRDYNGNQVHGCPIYAKPIERKLCLTRLPCLEGPDEDPFANYEINPKIREYLARSASYSFSDWSPCSVTCGTGIRTRNVTCAMYVSHTETLEERPEHDCEPLLAIKPNATEECLLSPCQQLLTDTDADIFDATTFATGTERNYENNITAKVQISSSNIVQSFDSSSFSQGLSFPSESAYSVDSDYNRNKVNDKGSEVRFSIPSDYDYSQYNEKYIWRQSGLTECSRSCAGGIQETVLECYDFIEDTVVRDTYCVNSDPFPKSRSMCNEQPCPVEWKVLLYSECTHTCGSGRQYPIKVLCIQVFDASTDGMSNHPDSECEDLPRPESVSCANFDCDPHWVMNVWSPCTEVCGSGTKSRMVSCKQTLGNGEEVDRESRKCSGYPPLEIDSCNEIDCPPSWLTGLFSECSVTCGHGQRFRPVKCTQILGNGETIILDSSECSGESAPPAVETCSLDVCFAPAILSNSSIFEQQETVGRIYLTVGQRATMFTKTTLIVSCPTQGMEKPHVQWLKGSAVIPQNRTMRVREISGGAIKFAQLSVDDSGVYTCQAGPLSENFYLTVVSHTAEELVPGDYIWVPGEWTSCTVTCGGGYQQRDVLCQHANRRGISGLIDPVYCAKEGVPKPADGRACNRQLCTPHWVTGEWSQCSSNCRGNGMGTKAREIGCMNSSGNYIAESECESVDELVKPANISDCVTDRCIPTWHVSHWTPCTATCGGGMRKRMIKCMYRGTRKLALQMFCKMVSPAPPVFERCNTQDCPAALNECADSLAYCELIGRFDLCNDPYYQLTCCATCATL